MKSQCCNATIYRDRLDNGHWCSNCDAAVDPKTGRELTQRERDAAYGLADPVPHAGHA